MKILVLGATGMLGSMVYHFLKNNSDFEMQGSYSTRIPDRLSDDRLINLSLNNYSDLAAVSEHIKSYKYDYVINCIGIIKQRQHQFNTNDYERKSVLVNAVFPNYLADISETRIIQIATDCVYSGKVGWYNENDEYDCFDIYGKTKALGEVNSENYLNIRCSIIGPEMIGHLSLMDWFLLNKSHDVRGYIDHIWNGVTTLQFAQLCMNILEKDMFDKLRSKNHILHYIQNLPVSKYQLLLLLKDVFSSNICVSPSLSGFPINRTLSSIHLPQGFQDMRSAVESLGSYIMQYQEFFTDHGVLLYG